MNGSGTADSPWEITTAQELASITASNTGYYKLMNDLDCSDVVFDGDFKLYQSNLNLNGKKIECFYYNKNIPFKQSTIHDGQIIKIIDATDKHEFARDCQFNKVSMYFKLRGQRSAYLAYETGFYQCNVRVIGGISASPAMFDNSSAYKAKISNSKFHIEITHTGVNTGAICTQSEYSYFTGNIVENSTNAKAFYSVSKSCIYDISCDPSSTSTYGCIMGNISGITGTIYNSDKHTNNAMLYMTPVTTAQLKSYAALTSPEINFDVEEVT